jgi:hypothetical protein
VQPRVRARGIAGRFGAGAEVFWRCHSFAAADASLRCRANSLALWGPIRLTIFAASPTFAAATTARALAVSIRARFAFDEGLHLRRCRDVARRLVTRWGALLRREQLLLGQERQHGQSPL